MIGGDGSAVRLIAGEGFDYALAQGEQVEIVLSGQDFAYAPVAEGADAGTAYILLDGKAVGKVTLIYGETVEQKKEEKKSIWTKWFGGTEK